MISPLAVSCPACFAQAGEPCTQPTDTGRRPVRWFHFKREDEVLFVTEMTPRQSEPEN